MASSSQIKPGEKGKIVAALDARDFKGQVVKEIWVFSNDPKRPKVTLTIKAEVVRQ
jgi:hypothetical protein